MENADALAAHLWDLRAQAESKLRCLTRVQQLLEEHDRATDPRDRAAKRDKILEDLNDVVTISRALRSAADDALEAAKLLT